MATTMKTPGVYIQELDAFGNSIVPVPTAVPVFIGYTEKAIYEGQDLLNRPTRITSFMEFTSKYGKKPPVVRFEIKSAIPTKDALVRVNKQAEKAQTKYQKAQQALTKANSGAGTDNKDLEDAVADTKKAVDAIILKVNALSNATVKAYGAALQARADNNTFKDPELQAVNDAVTGALNAALALSDNPGKNAIHGTDFIYEIGPKSVNYRMYSALKFFYQNGGGPCYIMSVGTYDKSKPNLDDSTDFLKALELLKKEPEPTLVLIPDAVEIMNVDPTSGDITYPNAYSLQSAMIDHCAEMMSRVAILDIPGGFDKSGKPESVEAFRDVVGGTMAKSNSYAAAYYPWLHTTVGSMADLSIYNIDTGSLDKLKELFNFELLGKVEKLDKTTQGMVDTLTKAETLKNAATDATVEQQVITADAALKNLSPSYKMILENILDEVNLLPPSAGMAGIYAVVDDSLGVWKAPANVSIGSTIRPAVKIDHATQEDLNVPLSGKSVCAIRAFPGMGNLVWGARTLDGNSNDWRYINVRRTLIFIEQSVKEAAKAYVFAPNDASTWVDVQSMISNFLTGLWKQGGLVGPKPADAFSVSVGLGSTMTGDDVLNGIMRVMVKVAVSRPAEFIEITFQQEMQKG